MTDRDEAAGGRPLRRNRDFIGLTCAQGFSLAGREMETLVMPLLVLGLTHQPSQVGLVAACQSLPYLILSLPAGALVDRSSRRRVMILCEAVRALAFASLPLAWLAGALTLAQLYIVALVAGSAFVFHNVAEISAIPLAVDKPALPKAMAANSIVEWVGENTGPALGGLLTSIGRSTVAGAMLAYAVQAAMLASSLPFLLAIRSPLRAARVVARRQLLAEIGEGATWLLRHPEVRALALLAMATATTFAPLTLANIVLARNAFHASPAVIGLVFACGGGVGLTATLVAPWIRKRVRLGIIVIGGDALWAVGLALLASSGSVITWAFAGFIMPFVSGVGGVAGVSYRLALIPEAMQGRVNSVFRFMAWGAQPVALAVGGVLIQTLGPRATLWIMAAVMTLVTLAAAASPLRRAA